MADGPQFVSRSAGGRVMTDPHVVWVRIAPLPGRSENVASLNLIENIGIEGDRHAKPDKRNQVLIVDIETLDQLDLQAGDLKENIGTQGIDVAGLAEGDRVRIGTDVEVLISHSCAPCHKMNAVREGLEAKLEGRRGMLGVVSCGGVVLPGDPVHVVKRNL